MKHLSLVGLLALSAGAAFAQTPADEAAIRGVFQRLDNAVMKKDPAGIQRELTKDAVWINPDGQRVNASSQLANMKQQLSMVKKITNKTTVRNIKFQGGKVIVSTSSYTLMLIPNPQTKKDIKVESRGTAVDTLVKVNGAWKVKEIKLGAQEMFMDGKKIAVPSGKPAK